MKKRTLFPLVFVAVLAFSPFAMADLVCPVGDTCLTITPTTGWAGPAEPLEISRWEGTEGPGQTEVDAAINAAVDFTLTDYELYKSNVGGSDERPLATSYATTFDPSEEPTNALIQYVGGDIVGPTAYLLVKDGAAGWYLFNLTVLGWDGEQTLLLSGFWQGVEGAISHVTLYGTQGQRVPEPSTLLLLGAGLVGLGILRRRK